MVLNDIILVDLNDREIGRATKAEAHAEPLLHRAFSLFLYYGDKLLIQQRAIEKYHSGGLWANTCCSHPRVGERLTDSVQRRLLEETGLVCDYVEEIFAFPYCHRFAADLYEYEYDHVFIGELSLELSSGSIMFDTDEIAQMAWVDFDVLLEDLRRQPMKYAPWFIIAAPRVIAYLRGDRQA